MNKNRTTKYLLKRNIFLLFSLYLLVVSCSKEAPSTCNNLYQTFWVGTLKIKYLDKKIKYDINISFDSEKTGGYYIDKFTPKISFSSKTDLKYEIDHNLIYIRGGYNNILTGCWWITSCHKDELILKRNIENQLDSDELHIIKQ